MMNFSQWLSFIILALVFYIVWQIRQLLLLLFTAAIIANFLNHGVQLLQKFGIKRAYSVLLSISILLIVLSGFCWIIIPPFAEQLPQLLRLVPQGIEQLTASIKEFVLQIDPELINALPTKENIIQQLQPLLQKIAGQSLFVFYTTLGIPLTLLLLLALSLMLLVNPASYRQGFIRLFPGFYRKKIDKILTECDQSLQAFLTSLLFQMVMISILSFIGLSIIKVPLTLAQAMLAGILTFIPNIGSILSVIPPMAIALLENPWKSLVVLIFYIISYIFIHKLETKVLPPIVIENRSTLLPGITLLSQVFFTSILGILGFFLALPLAVVSQVWLKEVLIKDILDQWKPDIRLQEKQISTTVDNQEKERDESV
jgi:predicted PurR-regulated permease PerM